MVEATGRIYWCQVEVCIIRLNRKLNQIEFFIVLFGLFNFRLIRFSYLIISWIRNWKWKKNALSLSPKFTIHPSKSSNFLSTSLVSLNLSPTDQPPANRNRPIFSTLVHPVGCRCLYFTPVLFSLSHGIPRIHF